MSLTGSDRAPKIRPVPDFSTNNFDLLRLLAAVQVVYVHAVKHFALPSHGLYRLPLFFSGVPIFFFISGFLISAAWERNPDIASFARNRALRIFPGYWAALLFSFIAILFFYPDGDALHHPGRLLLWAGAQLTMLADWNPRWLHGYGSGNANGALWTIPVELCFYVSIPILYGLFRRFRRPNLVLGLVIVGAFAAAGFDIAVIHHIHGARWLSEFIAQTPLPWIGMFAFGILAQRHRARLLPLVAGRFWIFLLFFAGIAAVTYVRPVRPLLMLSINFMGAINFTSLCLLILSAAYTRPRLAQRLLHRTDISYGIYLFHMPVMNIVLMRGLTGYAGASATAAAAILLAILSWLFIEKPALRARRRPAYLH